MPESSLITRVLADIRELEKALTAAERRWKLYNERASKLAAVSVSGGAFGSFAPRGGGATSATAQQKSDLKRQEEEFKASLKRQQSELEAALRARSEARKSAQARDEAILKAGLDKERELLRQRGQSALQEQRNQDRLASEARAASRRASERDEREARAAELRAVREAAAEAKRLAREERAIRETQRLFREKTAKDEQFARRKIEEDARRREREADQRRRRTEREIERTQARQERETRDARRVAERVATQSRRDEASSLRGQITRLVGPGVGAGPPFGPLPTGSGPEAIVQLRRHLELANSAGARLSRTLRRIGDEDLRKMEQGARFFRNAIAAAVGAAAIGGFAALVKRGIELNREWERFRFGLGTALSLTSKVVDAQGKTVTGARAFRVFAQDAEGFFKQIRGEANKTILTTEELVQVVTENFANAVRAGIPEQQIVGVASRIAQVGKSLGLPGGAQQLSQETRAILEGENLRNATVAKTLGLTTERIKQAKEEGKLLELINSELTKADVIIKNFEQSSEAAFTTLLSKGQDFLRLTLEDVFKRLTGRVLDFNKELSSENIERFARRAGRTFTNLFRPIERFIESGQAAKLGEAFAQGFRALDRLVSSGAFDKALGFFNFLVANADKIVLVLGALGALRGLNAIGQGLANLRRPGGALARALPTAAESAGGFAGGAIAGTAGARLRGLFTRAGAGAAARGVGGALLGPLTFIGTAAAELGLGSVKLRREAEDALSEQRAGIQREPGQRAVRQRLGIARDALQQVQAQIREAAARGERPTTQTPFPVALGGDSERTIQLSFEQAQRRVQIAEETQNKLRRIEKAGGDRRVQDIGEKVKQILDLEKIGFEQRIAQFEGNVKKQIELETVLAVAGAQVGKDAIKNEEQRQRFIAAARAEGGRKLRELERTAFFDTARAEADATGNRRLGRQVGAGEDIAGIRDRVRTQQITAEQGQRQINARLRQFRREDLEDFRSTRDRAVAIQDDFQRATLRALREQRDARKSLVDFQRQLAREERSLVRERIQAERDLTEAIRQQQERREDVALSRGQRALRDRAEQQLAGFRVRGPGLFTPDTDLGTLLASSEARRLAGTVGGTPSDFAGVGQLRGQQLVRDLTERLLRGDIEGVLGEVRERRIPVDRADLREIAITLAQGGLGLEEQRVGLGRRREVAGEFRDLAEGERAVQERRERLGELGEREADLREDAARNFRDLVDRIADSTIDLRDQFNNIAKQARELVPDLGQFGAALKPLANIVNEIAKLTPGSAAARAAALGPANVNLTVDLQGALGSGTVLDPLVEQILSVVFSKLEQQFRRGPVGGR